MSTIRLPALVTVYHGRRVYINECPAELPDGKALARAGKRLKDFAAKCTSKGAENVKKRCEKHAAELEAAAKEATPKADTGGKKGK